MAEPHDIDQDWDAIAAEVGLPEGWRAAGFDSAEYMVGADSIYHVRDEDDRPTGALKCPFPHCGFRRRDVEAMFRHAHGGHLTAPVSGG